MTRLDIGQRFVDAYARADADAVAGLFAPDVVSDINVPQWRYSLCGSEALAETLRTEEFRPGYRLTSHSTRTTSDGAVVEIECRFEGEGGEKLAREVHLLRERDGEITDHVMFCTGVWDADTIRRHEMEAGQP